MESRRPLSAASDHETAKAHDDFIYDGLHVQLQPSRLWVRALALAVDYGILYVIIVAVIFVLLFVLLGGLISFSHMLQGLDLKGQDPETVGMYSVLILFLVAALITTMISHIYFIYFEYKKNGQTPGKKIFGLRVVTLDDSPLSFGSCMMREVMRYIDLVILLPGLLSVILSRKNQRLGDLVAKTMVSYSRHEAQENEYLYVKQSDYLYLREVLNPEPVPQADMQAFLKFAYQTFIRTGHKARHEPGLETWEQLARRYVPLSTAKEMEQLTILLFFAEYCQQTMNRTR